MCRIRFLEIHICLNSAPGDFYLLSFAMRSLFFINLKSPATLEHLEFNVEFHCVEYGYDSLYVNLRDADLWRYLDSIATHPTDARLQRVDIAIKYTCYDGVDEPDKDKIKKAVFDGLPLLRMKGILFVYAGGEAKNPEYGQAPKTIP
jgi:hypothetical protein